MGGRELTVVGTAYVEIKALGDKLSQSVNSSVNPALDSTGRHAESASARGRAAFHSMFSTLSANSMGALGPLTEILDKTDAIGEAFDKEHRRVGSALLGIGTAATGVGVALTMMGDKDKTAQAQLQASIAGTGKSYEQYGSQIEETIKHGEHYGQTAAQTMSILNRLTIATRDPALALKDYDAVLNISALRHQSAERAVRMVTGAFQTGGTALRQYGIEVNAANIPVVSVAKAQLDLEKAQRAARTTQDMYNSELEKYRKIVHPTALDTDKLKAAHDNLLSSEQKVKAATEELHVAHTKINPAIQATADALANAKSIQGQADAQANTFTGHIHALTATIEDHVASIGQHWGPTIMKMGPLLMGVGTAVELVSGIVNHFRQTQEATAAAVETTNAAMAGSEDAMAVSEEGVAAAGTAADVALAPFLLIGAAVIALGVGAYEAYEHFKPFRQIIDDIAHFFESVFLDTFHAVEHAFDDVVGFFGRNWGTIKEVFIEGVNAILVIFVPFLGIPLEIARHWSSISSFFERLWGDIEHAFVAGGEAVWGAIQDVIGSVGRFPGMAMHALASLGGDLSHLFTSAWNVASNAVSSGIGDVIHFVESLPGREVAGLSRIGSDLAHLFSSAWSAGSQAVSTGIGNVITFVAGVPGKIVGAIGNIGSLLTSAGSDLMSGFIHGIESMGGDIINAIKGTITDHLPGFVKKALGIFSPSTVFAQIGKFVGQGFIQGVEGTTSGIDQAGQKMADTVQAAFANKAATQATMSKSLAAENARIATLVQHRDDILHKLTLVHGKNAAEQKRVLDEQLRNVNAQIHTAEGSSRDLQRQLTALERLPGTAVENQLLGMVKAQTTVLDQLGTQRDAIAQQLQTANQNLNQEISKEQGYASQIESQSQQYASILSFQLNTGDVLSVGTLKTNLTDRANALKDFAANITALKNEGLNSSTLRDILQGGVAQGGATASLLAGAGADTIAQINSLQGQIDDSSKSLGDSMGNYFYGAGVNAAQGIVNGLQSQQDAIQAQMDAIGTSMVNAIKSALKISSPSRVFHELGANTTLGLANGLISGAPHVVAAGDLLARHVRNIGNGLSPGGLALGAAATRASFAAVSGPTGAVGGVGAIDYDQLSRTLLGVMREYPAVQMDVHGQPGQDPNAIATIAAAQLTQGFRLGGVALANTPARSA